MSHSSAGGHRSDRVPMRPLRVNDDVDGEDGEENEDLTVYTANDRNTYIHVEDHDDSSVDEGLFDDDDNDDDFFDPGMSTRPKNRLSHRINTDTVTRPWQSLKQRGVQRSCLAGYRPWSYRERLLLAVAAILLVAFIIVIAILLASTQSAPVDTKQIDTTVKTHEFNNQTACQTKACLETAAELLLDMNTTVDPCTDFYAYACDGWITNNPLPDSKSRLTRFDVLHKKNRAIVRTILEGDQSPLRTSNESTEVIAADARNLDRLRVVYRACANDAQVDSRRTVPIRNLLAVAKKPFSGINENSTTPEALAQGLAHLSVIGIEGPLAWDAEIDAKNSTQYIMRFHQSGIGLSDTGAYRRPAAISSYKYQIARLFARILNDMPGENVNEIEPWVRDASQLVADFEVELASRFMSQTDKDDPDKSYHAMTLGELADIIPSVDIVVFIKTLQDEFIDNSIGESSRRKLLDPLPKINRDTIITVASVEYIKSLEELLKKTPPMTLHWYLLWRVIVTFGDSLDAETALLVRELGALVSGVHSKIEARRQDCITWIENEFSPLIGRYFVMQQLSDKALETVQNLTEQLRDSFVTRARELDWLDNDTRDKAIEKAHLMTLKIGAPSYPDTRSAIDLNAYYEAFPMNVTHHFENAVAIQKFEKRRQYMREWTMPASSVNMYYSRSRNSIVVPAGILQSPFYDERHADYFSYGSLGMFIAHELSHAFDNQGRKYDGKGLYRDWWSQKTKNRFEEKASCFSAQYARYTIDGPDGARLRINGKLTLAEIMAGNLSQAYRAWQTAVNNKTLITKAEMLPGFPNEATHEQLFFLNFGRSFCNVIRPEHALERIHTDTHPPMKHRVNGALKNNQQFADAYQCASGSPMNPVKKCQLW
ncbi:hypothetical protein BDF19DRAFT_455958 [Syncephalis fuscata]|nr:hypothetical protein BDF19DRAFT_455958 [Syncephalis fuscata]